jgi:hypothetical protein
MAKINIQLAVDGSGTTKIEFLVGKVAESRMAINDKKVTAKVSEKLIQISGTSHYWFPIYVELDPIENPVMHVKITTDGQSSMCFYPLNNPNLGDWVAPGTTGRDFIYIKENLFSSTKQTLNLSKEVFSLKILE